MTTKYQRYIALTLLTHPSFLFGSGLPEQRTMQGNERTQRDHVDAMLRSNTPLILLWGDQIPSSLREQTCWISKKHLNADKGKVSHHLTPGFRDNPPTKHGYSPRSEYWLLLGLYGRDPLKLSVEYMGNTEFGKSLTGVYPVVYADQYCFILRIPETKTSEVRCVSWVPANAAAFLHTKCKAAFIAQCTQCSRTGQSSPSGASVPQGS
uniref:Lipocalin n=1 Tax=Rhipicephalus appendiculatus TaxID=34631 RepID=A0A131YTI0_RHIAP